MNIYDIFSWVDQYHKEVLDITLYAWCLVYRPSNTALWIYNNILWTLKCASATLQHHLCTMETGIKLQLGLCLLKPRSSARLRRSEGLGEGLRAAGAGKRRLRMGLDTPLPRHTLHPFLCGTECYVACGLLIGFLFYVCNCCGWLRTIAVFVMPESISTRCSGHAWGVALGVAAVLGVHAVAKRSSS